ncbi:MAG TPA: FAD-dependent oxidoreductase, partial [Candidatus Methylomirabilis sp.]|nr:FAD-dependent oxidoreductase [Candidatus Methylomirabilis sp.]
KYIPGFEKARVEDSGVTVGVRISRNIIGEYMYTGYDILEERGFKDTAAYIVPLFLGVPYRCLVPKEVDNLLISGRCISTTPGQTSSGPTLGSYNDMKSIPTVMTYGEAAGTAAALCVQQGVTPRALDMRLLQGTLRKHGALLDRSAIDAIVDGMRLPNGTPFGQYLKRRQADLRKHWEQKGYNFSNPQDSEK